MEVYVYEGILELPSIDFECLRVLTYIRLSKAPVNIISTKKCNPFKSPNGFLPYLLIGGSEKICGYLNIVSYLKNQNYIIHSPDKDKNGLSDAYLEYLFKNLLPCMQYILWGDPKNADEIRNIYARKIKFPFNFYYPSEYIKKADMIVNVFEQFSIKDKSENHNITELLINAKKCINVMAHKLEDNNRFSQTISELDATLYSYLTILLHTNLTNNPLQEHIRGCPSLLKYINRMHKTYLKDIPVSQDKNENKKPVNLTNDDDIYSKKSTKIIAFIVSFSAMALFALTSGLLKISRDRNRDDRFNDNNYIYYNQHIIGTEDASDGDDSNDQDS